MAVLLGFIRVVSIQYVHVTIRFCLMCMTETSNITLPLTDGTLWILYVTVSFGIYADCVRAALRYARS